MEHFNTTIGSSKSLKMFDECSNFDGSIKSIYLAENQKVFSEKPLKSILKKCDSDIEPKRRVRFNLDPQIRYIPNRCQTKSKAQQSRSNNNLSNGSYCQDVYNDSRIFRPHRNFNRYPRQTVDEKNNYVQEPRSCFNETCHGYYNCNNKPNYSRSYCDDTFVFKIENIPNNVRVRDLKAALAERGIKPLHITWKGPRGFAYLRYAISNGVDKEQVMSSLHKISFKSNGVETSRLQTLIVTACQLY
ncbi:Hypothetical protein CINCED_3A005011 [Cinara cedri]|uniref:Uncharacterized protein n=1 Tax=Cinara cedri TaxID=506608 RepID=A0A5E4NIT1_9HEMI|nr:Hypothetical protein CINCED_3A005011 [Cinara cedri]